MRPAILQMGCVLLIVIVGVVITVVLDIPDRYSFPFTLGVLAAVCSERIGGKRR